MGYCSSFGLSLYENAPEERYRTLRSAGYRSFRAATIAALSIFILRAVRQLFNLLYCRDVSVRAILWGSHEQDASGGIGYAPSHQVTGSSNDMSRQLLKEQYMEDHDATVIAGSPDRYPRRTMVIRQA